MLFHRWIRCSAAFLAAVALEAQVYSPKVLHAGQVDASSVAALVQGIYARAGARTDREKAEAIWRFFLTDGRFVEPGFWYHIAGWAYEEPKGEVLDAVKLLNSYGFGLCYHIAPLLEAAFEAGGFRDARVWFLTGHSVAEVFYGGRYHYYDSDMMGYNCLGRQKPPGCVIASVRDLEEDGSIITGKLLSPSKADPELVADPWYPADLRAKAMNGLADLFTTKNDNYLFPFQRYSAGHTMDFVLRPGERMIRYFEPERDDLYYLPYAYDDGRWQEFPREVPRWNIQTEDGPKSQKDRRRWATGRIEYRPSVAGAGESAVFEVASPYVILGAQFIVTGALSKPGATWTLDTSTDGGHTWVNAGTMAAPFTGSWRAEPKTIVWSPHGRLTAVSGAYQYLLRLSAVGGVSLGETVRGLRIITRFQLNPRTLPVVEPGLNEFVYRPARPRLRYEAPIDLSRWKLFAARTSGVRYVLEDGQGMLIPADKGPAELVFEVSLPDGGEMSGFYAGGRFLEIEGGLAPDKLTAEVRKTAIDPNPAGRTPQASIEWSAEADGGYRRLWQYRRDPRWLDGEPVDRLLRWPEVDREVKGLPQGTRKVYVRYRFDGMALDDIRLAAISTDRRVSGKLLVTHVWDENGRTKHYTAQLDPTGGEQHYTIRARPGAVVRNRAIIFECR